MRIELPDSTIRDTVDMIEVNTYHDEDAFPQFTQLIFWDWSSFYKGWVVVAWKMHTQEIWKKSKEHEEKWLRHLREYCDKNPRINFLQCQSKYRGEYLPIPGINYPQRKEDGWYMVFYKDKDRIEIKAKVFRETHTQTDPERDNRDILPEDKRRGIRGLGRHDWGGN